jgi:integral membrane protein (TIGR01906 family)
MRGASALSTLVALTVFPLVAIGALRIVANDWIVHFAYSHGGLPADRYGFSDGERRELALLGLEAIRPTGRGIELLRDARLSTGAPAFGARELRHMDDVRTLVGVAFRVHTALLGLVVVLALTLRRSAATRVIVPRGLRWGAIVTLAAAAGLGLFMTVAWQTFFDGFHNLFFDGRSWWFFADDTLRRVYPDEFWIGVAAWIAGTAAMLTAAVGAGATWWSRRLGRAGARGAHDEMVSAP